MESSREIYQDSEGISFATSPCAIKMGGNWHLFGCGQPDIPTQVSPVLWLRTKGLSSFTMVGRGTVGSGSGGRTTVAGMKSGPGSYPQLPATRNEEPKSASQVNTHATISRPIKSGSSNPRTAMMYSHITVGKQSRIADPPISSSTPNFSLAIPRSTGRKANSIGQRINSSRVLKASAEDIWTLTSLHLDQPLSNSD